MRSESSLAADLISWAESEGVDTPDGLKIVTVIGRTGENEINEYEIPIEDADRWFHEYRETAEVVVNVEPL